MASSNSPPPSSMAISPSSSPPPPSSTQPPIAQSNATSDPPASSNSPPSTLNSPPPSLFTPNTPPPTINAPPPTINAPPPTPNDPSPPTPNDPPPAPPTSSPSPPTPILTPSSPSPPSTPTPISTPPPQSPPIPIPPPQSPPIPIPPPQSPPIRIPTPASPPPPTPIVTPPPQSPTTPTLPPPTSPNKSPPSVRAPPPSPPLPTPPPPASTTPEPIISPPSPVVVSPPKFQDPPSSSSTPSTKKSPSVPSTNPSAPSPPKPPNSPLPLPTNRSTSGPNVTTGVNENNGGGGGGGTKMAMPVAIVTSLLVLSLMVLAVWFFKKRKKRNGGYSAGFVLPSSLTPSQVSGTSYPQSPSAPLVYPSSRSQNLMNKSQPDPSLGGSKTCFSYEELYNVTNGFSDENLLGEGGFGCVYKGCLSDGREVAVKQLKVGGSQGEREFRAEVEIIGRVHHRHLVSLVGYCIADTERLLVYDFVPNDTLHHHLHGEGRSVMKWEVRLKVATGAARGIAYLHEDCHPRIIHRDIKSSNILLDNEYEAQVSDFGLARLAMDAATHVTTRVMGTFGYLAPEYASSGKLTERSDVYSFGVVLLELITGRKPVDTSQPIGDESLVEWSRPQLTHALETSEFGSLIDPRLETNYNENEMYRMIETAAACIRHSAPMRPRMGLVARALEGLADIDLSNGVKPGQSELYSAKSAELRLFQRMAFGNQNYSSDFSSFSNFSGKSQRDY